MSKKFGKLLLLTTVAGAAAYGTYSYLQKKEHPSVVPTDDDDDFDDFSEDLDDDLNTTKERSYVSLNLDKAEAIATEAFQKAKEVITDSVQQVKETVKSVADSQGYHTDFASVPSSAQNIIDDTPVTAATPESAATTPVADANETVEEFFDEEEDEVSSEK